jgi:cysteinyl-tRNA synthetase
VDLGRTDLEEADAELTAWRRRVAGWAESPGRAPSERHVREAVAALDDDLDTPAIFPVLFRLAEDIEVPPGAKFETVIKLDMILGLDLVGLVGRL